MCIYVKSAYRNLFDHIFLYSQEVLFLNDKPPRRRKPAARVECVCGCLYIHYVYEKCATMANEIFALYSHITCLYLYTRDALDSCGSCEM